jgi:hypothetical protein
VGQYFLLRRSGLFSLGKEDVFGVPNGDFSDEGAKSDSFSAKEIVRFLPSGAKPYTKLIASTREANVFERSNIKNKYIFFKYTYPFFLF